MAKVRATRNGFHGSLRYPGDEFEMPDEFFIGRVPPSWVEVLEGPKVETPKPKIHPADGRKAPRPSAPVPVADGVAIPLSTGKPIVDPTPDTL